MSDVSDDRKEISRILSEYYEPEEIALWWDSSHPMLGGKRAVDVLAEPGGERRILIVLHALDHAVYV